jgi:AGCS family alanine or glycine:cation symporter
MSVAGSLLLITNLLGIFKLRHQIVFSLVPAEKTDTALSGNGNA